MSYSTTWSAVVFAHNVERTIVDCLNSVIRQEASGCDSVIVIVNGSRDRTEKLVDDYSEKHPNVELVTLTLADKASAWNHYVHEIGSNSQFHFFIDGDVVVSPGSFRELMETLQRMSEANAAGALPLTGRDRTGWSRRMISFGLLAGGLYAIPEGFMADLRNREVRLPMGLIGDDLFVSCLAKGASSRREFLLPNHKLVFAVDAGFSFESLDVTRPGDWAKYVRRLVRYRIRDHQLKMLLQHLEVDPLSALPSDVQTLYQMATDLPDYYWRGWATPFDILAVSHIRRAAKKRDDRNSLRRHRHH
jgi:glycosyltransferase involved in cell wall biosynthesis